VNPSKRATPLGKIMPVLEFTQASRQATRLSIADETTGTVGEPPVRDHEAIERKSHAARAREDEALLWNHWTEREKGDTAVHPTP